MVATKKSFSSAPPTSARRAGAVSWEDAPTELTRRCVMMEVHGDTGTGRSTLALTAPGPIALIHAAEKIEGIVQPFAREKQIRLLNFGGAYEGSELEIADQADAVWAAVKMAVYDAYTWARTIIIDTHTELWELIRLARFGALKPERGRVDANYGPVNAEWRSLFKSFRAQNNAHLIVLGQTKDEYKEDKKGTGMGQRTGRTIIAGQKEIPYMSDVVIRTSKDFDLAAGGTRWTAQVEKGWWNGQVEGTTVDNDMSNFATLMGLITETDPDVWMV